MEAQKKRPEAAGRPAVRLSRGPGSPLLFPPGVSALPVWDSSSSGYYLALRELHWKERTFVSARLNLIYDERAMSLCGAHLFPPPPTPISRRLTWFISLEALGLEVFQPTPNAVQPAVCEPGSEPSYSAGSAQDLPLCVPQPILCAPPTSGTAWWQVSAPGYRWRFWEECAHQDHIDPGQEFRCFNDRYLDWACRAEPFSHISVGSGGTLKLSPFSTKIIK